MRCGICHDEFVDCECGLSMKAIRNQRTFDSNHKQYFMFSPDTIDDNREIACGFRVFGLPLVSVAFNGSFHCTKCNEPASDPVWDGEYEWEESFPFCSELCVQTMDWGRFR